MSARRVLFPIYAMNVEVARAPWAASEPMIAEMRLQWWRDALAEIASEGPVRRHEVTTPLSKVLTPQLAARLDACLAARRWDIYRDPFDDAEHFDHYIDETSGTLLLAAARALGDADETTIRQAAFAQGLANWMCAIPELEARGRKPLTDGRPAAVAGLARSALDRLALARRNRAKISPAARPALLAVWRAGGILRQAASDPTRVAAGTLGTSEARRRFSLVARSLSGRW